MIKVEIERDLSIRGYAIWITNESPDGTIQVAKPVEMEFADTKDTMWDKPTLRFMGKQADEFLRGFATALAASGFKADELIQKNQEIAAIKYHLEDMRTLVFKPASRKSKQ